MSDDVLKRGEERAKELGLLEFCFAYGPTEPFFQNGYRLEAIHRLLGGGIPLSGGSHFISPPNPANIRSWYPGELSSSELYQGLLIGIREIKPGTREEKLEKLLHAFVYPVNNFVPIATIDAAKALLEEK